MADGLEITVRNPRTGQPVAAKMRADDGKVVVYDLPPGEAFVLDPAKDVGDFQLVLGIVADVALKQRRPGA
jgi:hypothetical protein